MTHDAAAVCNLIHCKWHATQQGHVEAPVCSQDYDYTLLYSTSAIASTLSCCVGVGIWVVGVYWVKDYRMTNNAPSLAVHSLKPFPPQSRIYQNTLL